MKLFIENQKVEKEMDWVLNQVRLHMNGATSAQMKEGGIKYRLNYGVGIPHLKQLASRIPVSYDLAERLWFLEVRETMILAALVVPDEEMTLERCLEWSEKIDNVDQIEHSAMFLWGRLAMAGHCVSHWFNEGSAIKRALAFYTVGRMVQLKPATAMYSISDVIKMLAADKDEILVLKAASFLIRSLLRTGKKDVDTLAQFIFTLSACVDTGKQMIAQNLQTEVDFISDDD